MSQKIVLKNKTVPIISEDNRSLIKNMTQVKSSSIN